MIRPSLEGALVLAVVGALSFKSSMRFSRLAKALDLAVFSWPLHAEAKLTVPWGRGQVMKESMLPTKVPEEQTLRTELVRLGAAPRWGAWLVRLPVLGRTEATSWVIAEVRQHVFMARALFRWTVSGDSRDGVRFGEKTPNSSSRDHLLLSLWKVHLPLIAQGSSSRNLRSGKDRRKPFVPLKP